MRYLNTKLVFISSLLVVVFFLSSCAVGHINGDKAWIIGLGKFKNEAGAEIECSLIPNLEIDQ